MRHLLRPFVLALCVSIASPATANVFGDIAGILTDPLKIGKASDNAVHAVERAAIHMERILELVDEDIDGYLSMLDKTVRETRESISSDIETIGEIADATLNRISDLEKQFIEDTSNLIKCAGPVTSEALRSSLAEALNDLGQRKPRFTIFGFEVGAVVIDASDISSPIQGFRDAKSLYEKRISSVGPEDHPAVILDSYAEIQRLADLTRCHYESDTSVFEQLYQVELEYNRRDRFWIGKVNPL